MLPWCVTYWLCPQLLGTFCWCLALIQEEIIFFFKEVYAFKKAFGGEEVLMVTILIMALDIQYKYLIYCYLD